MTTPNNTNVTWPTYITDNQAGPFRQVSVTGENTSYAVVHSDADAFSEAPDGFVGCIPDTQFFFISDEVPELFQELFMAHEVYEYALAGGPDEAGNCLKALHYELTLIPKNIRGEYLVYRRDFFQRMVDFYAGSYTFSVRRDNIRESLSFIETLV